MHAGLVNCISQMTNQRRSTMRKRDLLSAATGSLAAFAVAGGIAWAAIPGAGGVINGCYQKNEGQLRVIDPGTDNCRPSEVAIVWNQQGVKGEKGDKGEAADAGPGLGGRKWASRRAAEPAHQMRPTGPAKTRGAQGGS